MSTSFTTNQFLKTLLLCNSFECSEYTGLVGKHLQLTKNLFVNRNDPFYRSDLAIFLFLHRKKETRLLISRAAKSEKE